MTGSELIGILIDLVVVGFVLVAGFRDLRLQGQAGIAIAVAQAHPLGDAVLGSFPRHAAGQVDQQEFVVLDIQQRRRRQRDLGGAGRGKELPLRPHGNELAGPHGQRTGQQPGDAAEEHHLAADARGRHAHDEGQVADQPVVGAEDRGPEGSGQPVAAPGGQPADHFLMDLLVGDHGRRCVRVGGVRGAALRPLRQGQDEDRAEVAGQEAQELAPEGSMTVLAGVFAQQLEPVRLMAPLGFGQGEQDGTLLAAAVLRKIAVDGGLGAFVGEILAPALDVRGARSGGWSRTGT